MSSAFLLGVVLTLSVVHLVGGTRVADSKEPQSSASISHKIAQQPDAAKQSVQLGDAEQSATHTEPKPDNDPSPQNSTETETASGFMPVYLQAITELPGDGQVLIRKALKKHLLKHKVTMTETAISCALVLKGTINVIEKKSGNTIDIEWVLNDDAGIPIGSIKQNKTIKAVSLSEAWKKEAYGIAKGATDGLMQMIPYYDSADCP